MITFTLSKRLQHIIPKIINKDQSAYIKKRYIGCNARLIKNVVDYSDIFNKKGVLLCLDFEKAFDTVNWNLMYKVLEKFNLGKSLLGG